MIAILDFVFDEDELEVEKYRYDVKLTDIVTGKVFYDKLKFIYLEMPKFNKGVEELETHFEKWMYVLKHLRRLERVPKELQEKIFKKLFEVAELGKLTTEQTMAYRDSLKNYRDIKNSIDTAEEKGMEKGRKKGRKEGLKEGLQQGIQQGLQQGMVEVAKGMLKEGLTVKLIQKITGLDQAIIERLKQEINVE